ncbi:hypothetical protein cyc_00913 [Cyclospora cayetanensis]|uniref:Uncharacterized protein n=1 Tax=Cyclospora cayetanensis TaxID=88456 RepID=A0A1D3D4X5_9EIME|nr:hypothetical protein cyc_00913 [Cyclospora cayetanensis]
MAAALPQRQYARLAAVRRALATAYLSVLSKPYPQSLSPVVVDFFDTTCSTAVVVETVTCGLDTLRAAVLLSNPLSALSPWKASLHGLFAFGSLRRDEGIHLTHVYDDPAARRNQEDTPRAACKRLLMPISPQATATTAVARESSCSLKKQRPCGGRDACHTYKSHRQMTVVVTKENISLKSQGSNRWRAEKDQKVS